MRTQLPLSCCFPNTFIIPIFFVPIQFFSSAIFYDFILFLTTSSIPTPIPLPLSRLLHSSLSPPPLLTSLSIYLPPLSSILSLLHPASPPPSLRDADYDEFEQMLHGLTVSRALIKAAMGFAFDKVESAKEVSSCSWSKIRLSICCLCSVLLNALS